MGQKTKYKQGWLSNVDSNGDRCGMYIQQTECIYRVCCNWCSCEFDTGSRGFLSIKDHSQKKKHREVANLRQGQNPSQAVFGVNHDHQAQDEVTVDEVTGVVVPGSSHNVSNSSRVQQPSQPSQGQRVATQPSQGQSISCFQSGSVNKC